MTHVIPNATPNSVRKFFEMLCTKGRFSIDVADYRPDIFGNIQIVASNERYSIDYRRDRGDESVFVVVAGREYLVEDVRELLEGHSSVSNSLESELEFLQSNEKEIDRSFSSDFVDSSIKALEAMRVRRLNRMFPGSVLGG